MRLRKRNITPHAKDKFSTVTADFLGHTIPARGLSPISATVATLTKVPMPNNNKQVRLVLGDINYYGKFLCNLSRRFTPSTPYKNKAPHPTLPLPWKPPFATCFATS